MPQKLIPNHRTINSKQLLRAFTKQDKIEMVKCLSERQDVNWKLGEDGLMIRMGELVDSYPIYVLEVSLKNS